MLIIKDCENAIATIVGEMLNIETGTYHYEDGEPRDFSAGLSDYVGYPRVPGDGFYDAIRGSAGCIYVPHGVNLETLKEDLVRRITHLENLIVRPDGKDTDVLANYQVHVRNHSTDVKIKTSQTRTEATNVGLLNRNNRRISTSDAMATVGNSRFVWLVVRIEHAWHFTKNGHLPLTTTSGCSIMWDGDDVCSLPHGARTYSFSTGDLKYGHRYKGTTFVLGHPKAPLLRTAGSCLLQNMNRSFIPKVYKIDYDNLVFTKPTPATGDKCSMCSRVLYGENYALWGHIDTPEDDKYVPTCILCTHSKAVLRNYFRIFRVEYPVTALDMATAMIPGEDRNIALEALAGVSVGRIEYNGRKITYTLIGKKYVGFKDESDILFTHLLSDPTFDGRTACIV